MPSHIVRPPKDRARLTAVDPFSYFAVYIHIPNPDAHRAIIRFLHHLYRPLSSPARRSHVDDARAGPDVSFCPKRGVSEGDFRRRARAYQLAGDRFDTDWPHPLPYAVCCRSIDRLSTTPSIRVRSARELGALPEGEEQTSQQAVKGALQVLKANDSTVRHKCLFICPTGRRLKRQHRLIWRGRLHKALIQRTPCRSHNLRPRTSSRRFASCSF